MGARKCCLEVGIHQHHGVYRLKSMRETVLRKASCQLLEAPSEFCFVKILYSKRGTCSTTTIHYYKFVLINDWLNERIPTPTQKLRNDFVSASDQNTAKFTSKKIRCFGRKVHGKLRLRGRSRSSSQSMRLTAWPHEHATRNFVVVFCFLKPFRKSVCKTPNFFFV